MHGAIRRTIGTALGTAVVALTLPAGVEAAGFEITSLDDAGPGSLRAAIEAASEHPDTSSAIAFAEGLDGAIVLETPLPDLVKELEIVGPGPDRLAITRDPEADDFRIFTAGSGSRVAISGVTISGGRAGVVDLPGELFGDVVAGGGLLVAEGAELTLRAAVVRDNAASSSGTPSTAIGGGIASLGSLTIEASAIFDNLVETTGPASASSATGGGIASLGSGIGDVWDSTLSLRLTTVSGNRARAATLPHGNAAGGGIAARDASETTIESATIAANAAEGSNPISANLYFTGLFRTGSVRNTIFADPEGSRNCFLDPEATLQSLGHNLADDESCELDGSDDQEGVDPGLEPLADNGGPTPTQAIASGGPAHDKGNSGAFTADQRGLPRPVDNPAIANAPLGDGSDIGAFELQMTASPSPRLRVTGRPKLREVGPGKKRTTFRLQAMNVGDAPTGAVRLCAAGPSKRVRIIGQRCVSRQAIHEGGQRQRRVKVIIKPRAHGKLTKIKLSANGANVDRARATVRLRVRSYKTASRFCPATRVDGQRVWAGPFWGLIVRRYDVVNGRFRLHVGQYRDRATGLSQKIPWRVSGEADVGRRLDIRARRLPPRSPRRFHQRLHNAGGIFPSIIKPPAEGCWRLRFTSGSARGKLIVLVRD